MQLNAEIINIWPNERKLVPTSDSNITHELHCRMGLGYMRVMSESVRHIIRKGEKIEVSGDEIVTLTGIEHMTVELIYKTQGGKNDS